MDVESNMQMKIPYCAHSAPPQRAVIRFSGPDARSFLQGQLSTNLQHLSERAAQFTSYNSAKGRMLGAGYLLADGDDILWLIHPTIVESVVKRLRMFVLRAKLSVVPEPHLNVGGVLGEGAEGWLATQGIEAPTAPLALRQHGDLRIMRGFGATTRYLLLGHCAAADDLPEQADAWRRVDLRAGVPLITADTQDHFIAQHAGLSALGGLSFDKGCYVGQEIIARLHYRGEIKRSLQAFSAAAPCPTPGTPLYAGDQVAGEVVDAVSTAEGCELSAVLRNDLLEHELCLGAANGAPLTLLAPA
jgi:folate-binding protein YgfZ